jgi:hypothetical protein
VSYGQPNDTCRDGWESRRCPLVQRRHASGWLLTLTVDASCGRLGAFGDVLPLVVRTVEASTVHGLCQCVVGVAGEPCLDHTGVVERDLCGGAGVTVPGVDQVLQGSLDEAGG